MIIIVRPSRNSNVFHHNMCLWSLPYFMESHHESLIKTPVTSPTKHSHDQQHRNFVTHFIAFHHRIAIASNTQNPGNRCPRTIKANSRVLKTQVHHSPIPIQSRTNSSPPLHHINKIRKSNPQYHSDSHFRSVHFSLTRLKI
jgi:hypothetical protein